MIHGVTVSWENPVFSPHEIGDVSKKTDSCLKILLHFFHFQPKDGNIASNMEQGNKQAMKLTNADLLTQVRNHAGPCRTKRINCLQNSKEK